MSKLIEKAASKLGLRLNAIKLSFTACGEVMINGLPFSFGIESLTDGSEMGFCVTFSGEAIDSGALKLSGFERHRMVGGKRSAVKTDLPLVVKKDGKKIYQARFEGFALTGRQGRSLKKATGQELISSLDDQVDFSVTPHYSGTDTPDVMLSIYPFENPLNGSATKWLNVTADQDYFLHRAQKGKTRRKK